MRNYQSSKLFDGYSTVFRQWKAEDTHCKFLHGYAISFKVTFEGDLDYRNWVWDFGGMKRSETLIKGMSPKDYFNWLLDHTTIIAEDDPYLETFRHMAESGIIQLRVLPSTGCEKFAKYLFNAINSFVLEDTNGRVKVVKVEVYENERNSASYGE